MKIKTELGFAILFAINVGIIILAIINNILQHQWINISTNLIMLLVSIYFICHFIQIVLSRTVGRTDVLMAATELAVTCASDMLCYAKNLVKKTYARPEIQLDIVCEEEKYMPRYANSTDACMDLKIKIKRDLTEADSTNSEAAETTDCYFLKPNETQVFSTGIKVSIPEENMMLIFPRSSTGFKLNCMLTNTTGIIDAGYRDEVKLAITNFGNQTVCLKDAQRIAQFMIIPRPHVNLNLVCDDEEFRNGDRGGGVGSTGEQ